MALPKCYKNAVKIASDGVQKFLSEKYNVIIVDTAGRHKEEKSLLKEMKDISNKIKPDEIILVIDDNTDMLSFVKSHFIDKYLVFLSETGKEGFEIAVEAIPDIIISDIMLPDIDGRELCKKIKKDERTSHIPVIMLSALSSKENIMDGLEKGADDYISKPFDIMLLQKKVENILTSRDSLKVKYSKQITLTAKPISLV